ncbi:hypothetical protein KR044_010752, partial [Drosophila immigrans]
WFDALYACQKKKLCLADFDTKGAFDEMTQKFNISDEYWVGLNGYEKDQFRYISSNEGIKYMPPKTEIDLANPCAFLKPIYNNQLTFGTGNCLHRRRYVCSSADICNGIESNSNLKIKLSSEVPCDMTDEIKDIIGI